MTSAASLPSTTQLTQDASAYEREKAKTPDRRTETPSKASQGAAMIAVDRVVKLTSAERADNLASSSDGSLMINHDSSHTNTSVDGSTPVSQLDDREALRRQMSDAARAAVVDAYTGTPDNTQIPS